MRASLVRLYPRGWRDRYGDEFEAMLEDQPTNVGSVTDVVLGAVDAHLTAHSPERRGWWLRRLPALLVIVGSMLWLATYVGFVAGASGPLAALFISFGFDLIALGLLAGACPPLRPGGWGRRIAVVPAVALLACSLAYLVLQGAQAGFVSWDVYYGLFRSPFDVAVFASQAGWAFLMLWRSPMPRPPLVALAAAPLLMIYAEQFGLPLGVAGVQVAFELMGGSWLLVGLSLWRTVDRSSVVSPGTSSAP